MFWKHFPKMFLVTSIHYYTSLKPFTDKVIFKTQNQDPGASETIEEELGLTGATADDVETEYIRKICEHDIVTGMYYSCFPDNRKWGQSNLFKSLIPKIQIQILQTDIHRFPLKDYLKEFDDR